MLDGMVSVVSFPSADFPGRITTSSQYPGNDLPFCPCVPQASSFLTIVLDSGSTSFGPWQIDSVPLLRRPSSPPDPCLLGALFLNSRAVELARSHTSKQQAGQDSTWFYTGSGLWTQPTAYHLHHGIPSPPKVKG